VENVGKYVFHSPFLLKTISLLLHWKSKWRI